MENQLNEFLQEQLKSALTGMVAAIRDGSREGHHVESILKIVEQLRKGDTCGIEKLTEEVQALEIRLKGVENYVKSEKKGRSLARGQQ